MSGKTPPKPVIWEDAFVITPKYGRYPYEGLQIFGFFIVALFPLVSLITVGLRIYSRRLACGLGKDDWLIITAMVLAVPQAVMTGFVVKSQYWGIHDSEIPPGVPTNIGAFWILANGLLYTTALVLVKESALVFLLRLSSTKPRVRLACRVMIVLNLMQLITFLPLTLLQCNPIQLVWLSAPADQCIRRDVYSVSLSVVNITTDILTLLIPFFTFLDLKVNKRVRIALTSVFMLGAIATIVSAIRMYYVIRMFFLSPSDRHYSLGYECSCIEMNLGITTASVPPLWPLARRWFPGVFESLGINRLHPDIEVGYVTQRSRASRILRGKVIWQKRRVVLPASIARAHNSDEPLAGLSDVREQPVHTAYTTWNSDRKRGSADEEDMKGWTYHDLLREGAVYDDNDSLASQKLKAKKPSHGDRGVGTSSWGSEGTGQ
ncbi:hypothetical protein QBC47DRAFT_375283 [Echria macrotheca]|uniref:Rhodopsin domain-containing protein n=1 Tax=Echria macrotheca TaxID=438768 RepID=A0AAJ0FED1_9PEZI|nr:hypothetical protein QBC47DRAFT_375283 [Echria macrotheca]